MCRREEKGKAVAHPQHTATMVESDQATSSSTHCGSINSAGHSSAYRSPSGAAPVLICTAYNRVSRSKRFCPLSADLETETSYALYHKNDCPLIAKVVVQCRGERSKVVRYHNIAM